MVSGSSDSPQREERLGEVVFACLKAVESGQPLDRQEVLDRHPDLAAELAEFFADEDRVKRLALPLRQAPPAHAGETGVDGWAPALGSGLLPAGTRVGELGDYELLEEMGQGGMGVVYKARQ